MLEVQDLVPKAAVQKGADDAAHAVAEVGLAVLGRVAPRVAEGREPLLKEPFARAASFSGRLRSRPRAKNWCP